MIVTTTRPLRLAGEYLFPLEPFSVESIDEDSINPELVLAASDAVQLFFERAAEFGSPIAGTIENIRLVADLCAHADGLPLAIEMLAGCLRTQSLPALQEQLRNDEAWSRIPERGTTMDSSIKASYGSLSSLEQDALQKLSCFGGTWDLRDLQLFWTGLSPDVVQSLFEQSWLAADKESHTFRMLEPLRHYVRRLTEAANDSVRSEFVVALASAIGSWTAVYSSEQDLQALASLDRHYRDAATSLEWSLDRLALKEAATTLLQSLVPYWIGRNLVEDADRLCRYVLTKRSTDIDVARAQMMAGIAALRRRRFGEAEAMFRLAQGSCREIGYAAGEATALCNLALVCRDSGDIEGAVRFYSNGIAELRGTKDKLRLANALCNHSDALLTAAGGYPPNSVRWSELRQTAQENLAEIEELAISDPVIRQAVCHNLGTLHMLNGDLAAACASYHEAISICANYKLRWEAFEATLALADIALIRNEPSTAAKLAGLGMTIQRQSAQPAGAPEMERIGMLLRQLASELGTDRRDRLMKFGSHLDLADVAKYSCTP